MTRRKTYFFILILFLFMYCRERPKSKSDIFSAFLKSQFQATIPEEKWRYLIIHQNGCQGAIGNTLQVLEKQISSPCQVSVISSNTHATSAFLSAKWQILLDDSGQLDFLNLGLSNVSVLETENGKVTAFHSSPRCDSTLVEEFVGTLSQCP